ncbi:hypothetical protein AC579_4999 [Pseudocercospora musae]|uniref:Uncharacterized protein n=1 Tax=Pseudocercospora musae TaxID=113226 RepID=A0A139IG07_9PEZI|nr:hypothetical protein AC579_4999 [Pseudocercospora musae]
MIGLAKSAFGSGEGFVLTGVAGVLRVNMSRRSDGEVCIYLTDEYDWDGNASNLRSPPGECRDLTWPLSACQFCRPSESQDCSLYSGPGCRGEHVAGLQYPGSPDPGGMGFDKTARSWICHDRPPQNGLAELLGRYVSDTPTDLLARCWSKKREPSAGYALESFPWGSVHWKHLLL